MNLGMHLLLVDNVSRKLGTGAYKIGANYAPGVFPQKQAAKLGYVQNLWLSGPEHNLTEVRTHARTALFSLWASVELKTRGTIQ
jgi:branched-subunit amino acid aminotransferase/4-amino-4-deoxychorismate lyase